MSGLNNVCQCLYNEIRRQFASADAIVQSVNGQEGALTPSGVPLQFGLPARANPADVSNSTIITLVFVVLFVAMLFSMRRRAPAPHTALNKPSSTLPRNPHNDQDRDGVM